MNELPTPPNNSVTTGSQSLAPRASSGTGLQLGEHGAGETSAEDNDGKLVVSLMPMLGHSLRLKRCLVTTSADGSSLSGGLDLAGWDCEIAPGVDIEMLRAAYRTAATFVNVESDEELVMQALYALRTRTASRKEDAADIENRALSYVTELTKYPPDVVIDGLKDIARNQPFFPTLSEVVKTLDRLMNKRRAILVAIEIAGRKAVQREQPEARNPEIDDLRNDPCWIEWMRQVNDSPLAVKPWAQFQREWAK